MLIVFSHYLENTLALIPPDSQAFQLNLQARTVMVLGLQLLPQHFDLLVIRVSETLRLPPLQFPQLALQALVLLLQGADFLDVVGEAFVQLLQLGLLVVACGQQSLEGVRQNMGFSQAGAVRVTLEKWEKRF